MRSVWKESRTYGKHMIMVTTARGHAKEKQRERTGGEDGKVHKKIIIMMYAYKTIRYRVTNYKHKIKDSND